MGKVPQVKFLQKSLELCLTKWRDNITVEACDAAALVELGIDESFFDIDCKALDFPSTLSAGHRKLVHQLCFALQLFHTSIGNSHERYIQVSRNAVVEEDSDTQAVASTSIWCWCNPVAVKPVVIPYYFKFITSTDRSIDIDDFAQTETQPLEFLESLANKLLSLASDEETAFVLHSDASKITPLEVPPPIEIVSDLKSLQQMADYLSDAALVAFDCEMHQFRSYYGVTCLIQLTSDKPGASVFLVDTLALWDHIHDALAPLFANPDIAKVGFSVDGGDVPYLFRDFGIHIRSMIDLKIAVESLGIQKGGLVGMLERYNCPDHAAIAESKKTVTQSDWRVRPLSAEQVRYAALDVQYLVPLCLAVLGDISRSDALFSPAMSSAALPGQQEEDEEEDLNRPLTLEEIDDCGSSDDEEDWEGWGMPVSADNTGPPDSKQESTVPITPKLPLGDSSISRQVRSRASPEVVDTVCYILDSSQTVCDTRWHPKASKDDGYAAVWKLRKKKQRWVDKNCFLLRRLCAWRELTARAQDESPSYVCPPHLLLSAAYYLPASYTELMQMWSPLPEFVKRTEERREAGEIAVNSLLCAVSEGLAEWNTGREPSSSSSRSDANQEPVV